MKQKNKTKVEEEEEREQQLANSDKFARESEKGRLYKPNASLTTARQHWMHTMLHSAGIGLDSKWEKKNIC